MHWTTRISTTQSLRRARVTGANAMQRTLLIALTSIALAGMIGDARAQDFPSRPITMVVPWPPGGPSDAPARVIAERMAVSLGQPVIVENVTGASGSTGT